MSDALQTTAQPIDGVTVEQHRNGDAPHGMPQDKLSSKITLYSGVMPLTMTIEALVQSVEELDKELKWYVTLHLTGFGTSSRVFISETVSAVLDTVTTVPFPPMAYPPVGSTNYGLNQVGSSSVTSLSVQVKLSSPVLVGGVPSLQILNTTIDAQWIIGAIDILITDPPVLVELESQSQS